MEVHLSRMGSPDLLHRFILLLLPGALPCVAPLLVIICFVNIPPLQTTILIC
jgi:hypothetical protein